MFESIFKSLNKLGLLNFIWKMFEIACLIVFLSTVFSLFGKYAYFELFTHFRFQYVWISLICIIVLAFFHSWNFVIAAILCFLFNGFYVLPYFYPVASQSEYKSPKILRLLLANVEGNNQKYGNLIQTVKSINPDILVLQETTDEWWQQIQVLKSDYQFVEAFPRSGGAGMVLFSRHSIEKTEVLSFDSSNHSALFSKIKIGETLISFLTIHPPTPVRTDKFINRNKQFLEAAKIIKDAPEPKILIGDLNVTMWSPYFAKLVDDSGLRDARLGRGIYASWHTLLPSIFRIPIDHCLVSQEIAIQDFRLGDYTGSDHRPLIVDISLKAESKNFETILGKLAKDSRNDRK